MALLGRIRDGPRGWFEEWLDRGRKLFMVVAGENCGGNSFLVEKRRFIWHYDEGEKKWNVWLHMIDKNSTNKFFRIVCFGKANL